MLLRIAIGIYVLAIAVIYFFQDRFIYYPKILPQGFQFNFQSQFEERYFEDKNKYKIHGLIFSVPTPKMAILYFHGNAGALDTWGYVAEEISQKVNADVWVVDYPGFGKSSARFVSSESQLIDLGLHILRKMRTKYGDLPIVLYGRSLGSGVASEVAARESVQGVVLETPYVSLKKMAKETFPFAPSWLLKLKLDNKKLVNSQVEKSLVLHGTKDRVIGYHHSVELMKILGSRAELVTFEGKGHSDLDSDSNFWPTLLKYFSHIDDMRKL